MTYRAFEIPSADDFLEVLGVIPETVEGEEAVSLKFGAEGTLISLTMDLSGCSFSCRWTQDSHVMLEIFREGAVLLHLRSEGESTFIVVGFQVDGLGGELELQVSPVFAIRDRMLFR